MHSKVQKSKARYSLKSVHCSSSLHLALLEGNHITRDYWTKGFVGIMSSCYCLYCLQCSEQTMLLKKWWQALPHLCIATAELKCHVHFLAFWWEALDQLCLASALFAWQRVHPGELRQVAGCRTESSAGGCWRCWGLLWLPGSAGLKPAFYLVPRSQKQWGSLTCDGLAGLHLLSQCNFFILKVWLCSQYNENGVSEWIFAHENQ